MTDSTVKLYPWRWVVLAMFMLINVMVQVLWICYAPVASIAASAYGVSRENIDLLASLFLLIYLPVAIPRLLGHRHVRLQESCRTGSHSHGRIRPAVPSASPSVSRFS